MFEEAVRRGTAVATRLTDLLKGLCEARKVDVARKYFDRASSREPGYPPMDEFLYSAMVDGYLGASRSGDAWELVQRMLADFEGRMSTAMYSVAVCACRDLASDRYWQEALRSKCVALAERLVNDALQSKRAATTVIQPLLQLYAHFGRFEDASTLLRRCEEAHIPLDVSCFSVLISECADRREWHRGKVFWQLLQRSKLHVGIIPWNSYLKLCLSCPRESMDELRSKLIEAGLPVSVDGVVRLLQRGMQSAGIEFDCISFSTVVHHFAVTGQMDQATKWLQATRKAGQTDLGTYGAFLKPIARAAAPDLAIIQHALDMMRADGLDPESDLPFVCLLIQEYSRARRHDKAQGIIDRLLEASSNGERLLNRQTLSSILDSFGWLGGQEGVNKIHALLRALRDGKHGGLRNLNANVVCSTAEALSRCKEVDMPFETARALLGELGLRATSKILTTLAHGYFASGRVVQAVRRVEELLEDPKLRPSETLDEKFWDVMCGRVASWQGEEGSRGHRDKLEAARVLAALLDRHPHAVVKYTETIRALAATAEAN
eukprot:tig00020903_g15127.t1